MNDDPRLARSGGEEVPVQKGAYRLEKVEAALWTTPVGQVTAPIEESGAFYVAKVQSRKEGSVIPFEDKRAQAKIYDTLWKRQFRDMIEELDKNLRRESEGMVRQSPGMLQMVVDMAMQNYGAWASAH